MDETPGTQPRGPVVINGRYEVLRPLGSGGQGEVVLVRDHNTGQVGALKFLHPTGRPDVWHEAQVLAHLEGEYLLPVRNADFASGVPFIVTEVAEHGDTEHALTGGVGLPVATAVKWVRHASRGIARLHDRNLVHNDIKPGNIFLDGHGNALVGDVGYATFLDKTGHAELTGGTPATMAPELAPIAISAMSGIPTTARPCTVRTDVYSLGATAYWYLAGRPPYDGPDHATVLGLVAAAPPPDLGDVAPHVPQAIRDVIRRAMARDPGGRFASPAELDNALGRQRTPSRVWSQLAAHPGHSACFLGVQATSRLLVCAVPSGPRGRVEIRVTHEASGRRAGRPRLCTPVQLPRMLRTIFREHQ